jgi:Tol biopolymer transport system component
VRPNEQGSSALQKALIAVLSLALGGAGLLFAARAFSDRTTSSHAQAPVAPVANGLIAFGCGYHVCTVMPDGAEFTDLIEPYDRNLVLAANSPVFSPKGDEIAFRGYSKAGGHTSTGGANYDLFLMNTDGSGVANLTTSPEDVKTGFGQSYAQWSPDGSMVAYDGDDGLYVMNADGSDQRKLAYGASPTWSPDGAWIAFVVGRDHGADLWKMHPDGTGLTQLTHSSGSDQLPAWSPDGSRVAFLRENAIYAVNSDGTGTSVVAHIKGRYLFQPQWSPDGDHLAFEADNGHDTDIYIADADGSHITPLAADPKLDENWPVWSPDGSMIAFAATDDLSPLNDGSCDLYVMNSDGTGTRQLTTDAGLGAEFDITWQRV